ncbi:MAG: hypothetical protein ACI8TL_001962 [Natronomonas sp.]
MVAPQHQRMTPGPVLISLMIAVPILLLAFFAGFAYVDAPDYGMNPTKWAAISFFVPFFGFFAYLFERDERTPDPDREMYTDGVFEIHENRADDTRIARGGDPDAIDEDDEESRREPAEEWEQ